MAHTAEVFKAIKATTIPAVAFTLCDSFVIITDLEDLYNKFHKVCAAPFSAHCHTDDCIAGAHYIETGAYRHCERAVGYG